MSNYWKPAYHPQENLIRNAHWKDDHFGPYEYGVQFDDDGPVFRPNEVAIPVDVVFVPRAEPIEEKEDAQT